MIEALILIYVALGAAVILTLAAVTGVKSFNAARLQRKALSYLRRAEDGTLYVIDPESGALHRLDDQLVKRIVGEQKGVTGRQQKKIRLRVRQALGAH